MKHLLTVISIAFCSTSLLASPVYHPLGPNLTFGDVAHGQSIMSGINNPAAGVTAIRDEGDEWQFGTWTGFGVGAEIGAADNLFDEIDRVANAFNGAGITSAATAAEAVVEVNAVLANIEENGYAKVFASVQMPIMPIIISSDLLGGSLVIDANVSVSSRASVLHDPLEEIADLITINGDGTLNISGLNNDTTLLVKAAGIQEISLGYSLQVMSDSDGELYAGVRGKYMNVGLIQAVERIDTTTNSESLFDNIESDDASTANEIGVDIGVLWITKNYRVGATMVNANEPSFDFNDFNTVGYNQTGKVFKQLSSDKTYTMESQVKLEGALYTENQHWVLSVGFDANEVKDAVGDEYQWATFSAAYIDDGIILPGIRFGVRRNLAGSELNYLTGGLTLFNVLNLDLAYSTDTVQVDGSDETRGAIFNMGLEVTF